MTRKVLRRTLPAALRSGLRFSDIRYGTLLAVKMGLHKGLQNRGVDVIVGDVDHRGDLTITVGEGYRVLDVPVAGRALFWFVVSVEVTEQSLGIGALSLRLPEWAIQTRPAVFPDHTGIGATPL